MFVRWKRRALARLPLDGSSKPGHVRYAVLVKCVRIEGKPRQKVVCYLGHIKERDISSTAHRLRFWATVDRTLDALRLETSKRPLIEQKIALTVPRPSPAEWSKMSQRFEAWRDGKM
jgi:hypothetical protein